MARRPEAYEHVAIRLRGEAAVNNFFAKLPASLFQPAERLFRDPANLTLKRDRRLAGREKLVREFAATCHAQGQPPAKSWAATLRSCRSNARSYDGACPN